MADEATMLPRKRDRETEEEGRVESADSQPKLPKTYHLLEGSDTQDNITGSNVTDGEDEPNQETSPLTVCVNGDRQRLIELHANQSFDVNQVYPGEGNTLLNVACHHGHLPVAEWLVANGARLDYQNDDGEGLLHEGCISGNQTLVRWLMQRLPNSAYDASTTAGMTPISFACLKGHTDVARTLHEVSASLAVRDDKNHTLLHMACCNGHLETAKWLHTNAAAHHAERDVSGRQALHLACGNGKLETALWLHEIGAALDETDNQGSTPLHFATAAGWDQTAFWLIDAGVDAKVKNLDGNNPLHHAAQSGLASLVRRLLDLGVPASESNNDGDNAFLLACYDGHLEIADLLVAVGTPADAVNSFGFSGLIGAAVNGHPELVKWLLDKAPLLINRADNEGKTALDYAKENGDKEVLKILRSRGAEVAANFSANFWNGSSIWEASAKSFALAQPGNHVEYFFVGLLAVASVMLTLIGFKKFRSMQTPVPGLAEPLMRTHLQKAS